MRARRSAAVLGFAVAAALLAGAAPGGASSKTILIFGPTLDGDHPGNERAIAEEAGYDVTVASKSKWSGMSTSDFAAYDALVFGDPNCEETPEPLSAAVANRATWSAAIAGPTIVVGMDVVFHAGERGATALTRNAIAFAASGSGTGLYVNLSCYYFRLGPSSTVELLLEFGEFDVRAQGEGVPGCPDRIEVTAPAHPAMAGLTSDSLSNWGCSAHELFNSYPDGFEELARERRSELAVIVATPGLLRADVDVGPGSRRNPVRLSRHGVVTVAILRKGDLRDEAVVASSVCFGDAEEPSERDCSEAHGRGHREDVNGDGRADWVLHFEVRQTGIDRGDREACLAGTTKSGASFEGCDRIRTL